MKTAISIEENLFHEAERAAKELNISRSKLYSQALEYFLNRKESLEIIKKLNEIYRPRDAESKDSELPKVAKAKMRKVASEW